MRRISVIIPTYNRIDSLRRTFSYLEKSKLKPLEVLIIDQSNADFSKLIQTLCGEEDELNVVYNHLERPSLTAARNVGIKMSKGDVLVFMDDDVDVDAETLSNVVDLFKDERLVMAGGLDKKDVYHNSKKGNSKMGYLFGKSKFSKRDVGHMASGVYGRFPQVCGEATPTEWVMGFFFAVKRDFIMEHDCRFDEHLQYYAYAEDLDFSYGVYLHADKCGKKCIFSNRLIVNHNVSTEYRTPTRKATFMNYLHRYYICRKYNLSGFKFWWSNFGDLLFRLLKKESLLDYFKAMSFLIANRNSIRSGNFMYKKFM